MQRRETALHFAEQRGKTPVGELLVRSGAQETGAVADPVVNPRPAGSARTAVERSIPLLQRSDVTFIQKSGCVSCHNNGLTAMSMATVRKSGLAVNETITGRQLKTIATYIDGWRERTLQGIGIPGDSDTVSYILMGLAAESYPRDVATDALAIYLRSRQLPDGHWSIFAHRPPLESSDIEVTAASMRALQIYGPKALGPEYRAAAELAATWLKKAQPRTNEERAFQLLGLGWSAADHRLIAKAARAFLAEQRPDGGWAQLPSLASDAYATGQALVALKETASLRAGESASHAWSSVSDKHATRRWIVVREEPRDTDHAFL